MEIKNRNIAVCIILTIITCGIYGIYWFIVMTNESNALAPNNATASGGMAFLFSILTLGIYAFYWTYKLGCKVDEMKGTQGNSGILYLILTFFCLGIIPYCLAQDEINKHATAA